MLPTSPAVRLPTFQVLSLVASLLLFAGAARAADGPGAAAFASMLSSWRAGNLDAAIASADAVLKAEPKNVVYLNAIGGLYCDQAQKASLFSKLSWAGKCRSTWEGALALDPRDLDIRSNLVQFYAQAPSVAGGGLDKAKAQAAAIAEIDASRGDIAWATIALAEKNPAEAERRYRHAAEIDPAGMRGPAALASFYAGEKRWAEAKAVFERRLAKNGDDTFAAYQLGRLLFHERVDVPKALALFDRYLAAPAVANGPTHADAWASKGQVLDLLGRKAEAIAAYEMALKLAPDHAGAARELKKLKG